MRPGAFAMAETRISTPLGRQCSKLIASREEKAAAIVVAEPQGGAQHGVGVARAKVQPAVVFALVGAVGGTNSKVNFSPQ